MRLLKILARTGMAEIMLALRNNPSHFGEIVTVLDYERKSTSTSIVTKRLKTLEGLQLISRTVLQDRKRRVRYALTKDGKEIANILSKLEKWDKKLIG